MTINPLILDLGAARETTIPDSMQRLRVRREDRRVWLISRPGADTCADIARARRTELGWELEPLDAPNLRLLCSSWSDVLREASSRCVGAHGEELAD